MWRECYSSLASEICDVLVNDLGFLVPTDVQLKTIPAMLDHKDVAVEAVTGSGKTLAFVVPILQILLRREDKLDCSEVGAVIVEPSRELAVQTYELIHRFVVKLNFSDVLLTGGEAGNETSKSANIIVATPGRLLHELGMPERLRKFKTLEVLVLDEADRLLQFSQAEHLRSIIRCLPKQRRTGLFSATLAEVENIINIVGMRNLCRITLHAPDKSSIHPQRIPNGLDVFYSIVSAEDKVAFLVRFIATHREDKIIVFFASCAAVEYFSAVLRHVFPNRLVLWLHGRMDNASRRQKLFRRFHESSHANGGPILLSTDLLARGIDFPEIDWVVQFDPPSNASTLLHRAGRTARLNKTGSALVILLPNEFEYVHFVKINQGVSLTKFNGACEASSFSSQHVTETCRNLALTDREIYEKGVKSFTSFVQYYQKHECSLIFQLKEVNLGNLANSYGLVHLPAMPELRRLPRSVTAAFHPPHDCPAPSNIPYKNANREKQRLANVQHRKEQKAVQFEQEKANAAISRAKSFNQSTEKKAKKKKRKSGPTGEDEKDWEEMAKDARLIKRLKAGKVSAKEFERAMGISSDSD